MGVDDKVVDTFIRRYICVYCISNIGFLLVSSLESLKYVGVDDKVVDA